jgi:hypothetical protein
MNKQRKHYTLPTTRKLARLCSARENRGRMQSWGRYCSYDVPNSRQTNALKQIPESVF